MRKDYEESQYLYKEGCDNCGSSDAKAVYDNGNTHCFSCGTTNFGNKETKEQRNKMTDTSLQPIEYRALNKRMISEKIARKYSYGYSGNKQACYYYNTQGDIVAQKFRDANKNFSWIGNAKESVLFGQHLFKPNKNKRIIITEGEIDTLSIAQVYEGKWPVVSVPNGANGAVRDCRKQLEYLLGFKEVVICFDNDEVGQEHAKKLAQLFPPKFAKIATLPLKDANDMLVNNRVTELTGALWEAKPYTPEGILSGNDIIARLQNRKEVTCYPFPSYMEETNKKTKGIRTSELCVFTSGTGSGKTTLIKQLQHHYYKTTDFNQALIHLEEPLEDTARDLVSITMESRVHMNEDVDKEEYMEKAKELFTSVDDNGDNRFCLYDSFGSMESEDLFNKIRFMVKGLNCKVIWLDHLSILVSGMGNNGDERRTIDYLMHELKSLTVELDCFIGLIVHLNNNTNGGKSFEEGGIPNLNNLRGSGGIKQLANMVISFSRNQQAEDETERNTSLITVLKCRYTGSTGNADYLLYNPMTGTMDKGEKPSVGKEEKFENEEF